MSYQQVCVVREGRRYSLLRGSSNSIFNYCSDGLERRLVKEAFRDMRDSIRKYALLFRRKSRRLFGFPLRIESPPPDVIGNKVFSGFWAGLYEYLRNDSRLAIIVLPQVNKYSWMIEYIDELLSSLSNDFKLLVDFSFSASTSIIMIQLLRRLLLELSILVNREPKRIYDVIEEGSGELITVSADNIGPQGYLKYSVYKQVYRPNTRLYNTVVLVLRNVIESIRKIINTKNRIDAAASKLGIESKTSYNDFKKVMDRYVNNLKEYLETLLVDENIRYILSHHIGISDIDYTDVYDYIVTASNKVKKGIEFSTEAAGKARQLFFPSTKIYELYVYANIVDALSREVGGKPLYERILTTTIDDAKIYFNHYPSNLSRIIANITRNKTPQPDILLQYKDKTIIIDAKYRYLDSNKPRLLGLGDAERLSAYLIDAARNSELRAVIVSLSTPPSSILGKIKQEIKPLNSKKISIEFIELNPDKYNNITLANLLNLPPLRQSS